MALIFIEHKLHNYRTNALHHLHLSAYAHAANADNEMPHTKRFMVSVSANYQPVAQSSPLRRIVTERMLKSELIRRIFVR